MNPAWLGIFGLVIVCAVLLAILFSYRQIEEERKELAAHTHVFSQRITEWARRCSCGAMEIDPNAPDGLPQYLRIMTTRQAKEDPIREGLIYQSLSNSMTHGDGTPGLRCDECSRVYPRFYPHCPYCKPDPEPSF